MAARHSFATLRARMSPEAQARAAAKAEQLRHAPTRTKTVETLTHDEATRKNIPTAEYQSVLQQEQDSPVRVAYERRNWDLGPQLVWRGKDEQDWSDLAKLRAKALVERLGTSRRYRLTTLGVKLGVLLVKLRTRLLGPLSSLMAQTPSRRPTRNPSDVEAAFHQVDTALDRLCDTLGLKPAA